MAHRTEFAGAGAAAAVVLTVILGGGFYPGPRMLVAAGLIVVWIVAATESAFRWDRVGFAMVGVIAWGTVSALAVGSSALSAKETLVVWVVAAGLLTISQRSRAGGWMTGSTMLVAGSAVVSAAIVHQASVERTIRVGGLLENPNVAVALLVPTLPLGLSILGSRTGSRWGWTILIVAGIVLTGSRAGLLGLVIALWFLLPRGRLRSVGVAAGSAFALAVLVWRFATAPDILAWHRVSIWSAVVRIWANRPLTGVGPGGMVEAAGVERILHADEIGRYQFIVGYAESTPLAILVQLGIVGLVLVVVTAALWWTIARGSIVVPRKTLLASVSALGCVALFHDVLTIEPVLWWWAVLLGVFAGPGKAPGTARGPASVRWLHWSVGLGLIWVTAWGIVNPTYARVVWRSGPPTTDRVVRVLRLEPWLDDAPAGRVRSLLATEQSWSWPLAAEALHWAETAVRVRPGLAAKWTDVGRVRLRIITDLGGTDSDYLAARSALERACELDPHLPWIWLERARLARVGGDHEQALALARHALSEEPNTVRGWLMVSRLELERGRIDAAREAYETAARLAPLYQRPGLSKYEKDLLRAPDGEVKEIQRLLIAAEASPASEGQAAP